MFIRAAGRHLHADFSGEIEKETIGSCSEMSGLEA
jgi:hypothetical protein